MSLSKCPVCRFPNASVVSPNALSTDLEVRCDRCGTFTTTEEAREELWSSRVDDAQRSTLSGHLHEHQGMRFTSRTLPRLLAMRPLSVAEKGDRLLAHLARKHPVPGRLIKLQCDSPSILAETHTWDLTELSYLARDFLVGGVGYLKGTGSLHLSNNAMEVQIAPAGWTRLAALRDQPASGRIGFIAMWFHPELNSLRDGGLVAAVTDAGYEPKVINLHEHINRIDDEIVSLIRQSTFVVADFTGSRGGVYFEAGLAMGLGLPVIWTCKQSTLEKGRLHFDVNHFNFLSWTDTPGGCALFKTKLQHRIESLIGPGPQKKSI